MLSQNQLNSIIMEGDDISTQMLKNTRILYPYVCEKKRR
jgi:hypothetical protein